jgi:hypothetical protein
MRCPEKWRRRYIENLYEPAGGALIVGSAVGAAEGASYQEKIETHVDWEEDHLLDTYSDQFALKAETTEVRWDQPPGTYKDSGAEALRRYHKTVAPHVRPVTVERKFSLELPDVDWRFNGYIDLEEENGSVVDLKVKSQRYKVEDADRDMQPTAYLLARRAEGNPAPRFEFHTMVRVKQPYAEVIPTTRTDLQMNQFVDRLYSVATEMAWRLENDIWAGAAPGSWVCTPKWCAHFDDCNVRL